MIRTVGTMENQHLLPLLHSTNRGISSIPIPLHPRPATGLTLSFFELVQKVILPLNCRSSGKFVLKISSIKTPISYENHHLAAITRRYPSHASHHSLNNTTKHSYSDLAAGAAICGNLAARAATSTPTESLRSSAYKGMTRLLQCPRFHRDGGGFGAYNCSEWRRVLRCLTNGLRRVCLASSRLWRD